MNFRKSIFILMAALLACSAPLLQGIPVSAATDNVTLGEETFIPPPPPPFPPPPVPPFPPPPPPPVPPPSPPPPFPPPPPVPPFPPPPLPPTPSWHYPWSHYYNHWPYLTGIVWRWPSHTYPRVIYVGH